MAPPMARRSKRYGKAAKAAADARYAGLTAAQQAFEAHRTWLLATTPKLTAQMHRALAAMYTDDPRFAAYYTKLTGDAHAAVLREIIEFYADGSEDRQ